MESRTQLTCRGRILLAGTSIHSVFLAPWGRLNCEHSKNWTSFRRALVAKMEALVWRSHSLVPIFWYWKLPARVYHA